MVYKKAVSLWFFLFFNCTNSTNFNFLGKSGIVTGRMKRKGFEVKERINKSWQMNRGKKPNQRAGQKEISFLYS